MGTENSPRLGFKALLWVLLGVGMVAVCALVLGNLASSHWVNVLTERELTAKDLVADILPPPAYLVEARLIVSQTAEASITHQEAAARLAALKKEYFERSQYWAQHAPEGLSRHFAGEQHQAAVSFWDIVDKRLQPALQEERSFVPENLVADLDVQYQRHRVALNRTVQDATAYARVQREKAHATRREGEVLCAAGGLLAVLTLGAGGWWLARKLWLQVGAEPKDLARMAKAIAEGDLTHPVAAQGPESLARYLEDMRCRLLDLLAQASMTSSEVSRASSEIASGVQEVATRLEQDAATLEQTRAATAQLTANAQASHEQTQEAGRLALTVEDQAALAMQSCQQAAGAITQAALRSGEIEQLVAAVKSLAFQTSILSLNAHIEAARAGEAGKGFAVVAHEVRKLAQDTNEAANAINKMAEQIGADLTQAKHSATQSLSRTDALNAAMQELRGRVLQVTHAADESLCSLQECTAALNVLDRAVQQNAAFAEESSAAAQSLSDNAGSLRALTACFRV